MDRLNKIKTIRENLAKGRSSIGSWIQIPDSSIAEIMGQSGYDWVAVDMEHGSISLCQLPDLFRALELGNTLPLARIAQGDAKDCKQALDAGAGGLIIPMVKSPEEVEFALKASKYPPQGKRGVGLARAQNYGENFDEYNDWQKNNIEVIIQIEHIEAVNNLEKILSVEGISGIFIEFIILWTINKRTIICCYTTRCKMIIITTCICTYC